MKSIYLIGSLKNKQVPLVAKELRELGFEVFDDWYAPGPNADDHWRDFEKVRGSTYKEALNNHAATHIYHFDKKHLERCDIVVMLMPCGKSGHLELGYAAGKDKKTFIVFEEEPERWDVMYQFADEVFFSLDELKKQLRWV